MNPQQILQLLPHAFQASEQQADGPTPLTALLAAMDSLHAPTEALLDGYAELFSAATCPERHYPLLGSWLTERHLTPLDATCERELLLQLGSLQARRGTPLSLLALLRLVTGCAALTIADSQRVPFHIVVTAPARLREHTTLITAVLDEHKPAHVTYELTFV